MLSILENNLDCFLGLVGLAFAMVGLAMHAISRGAGNRHKQYLAYFGYLTALRLWLSIAHAAFGAQTPALTYASPVLLLLSSLCLLEFARDDASIYRRRIPGPWIHLAVLAGSFGVGFVVKCDLLNTVPPLLHLVTGLAAASRLLAREAKPQDRLLQRAFVLIGASLAGFSLAEVGLLFPGFRTALVAAETFWGCLHGLGVSVYYIQNQRAHFSNDYAQGWARRSLAAAGLMTVVLALSDISAGLAGHREDSKMREATLERAQLASAALEKNQISQFLGSEEDLSNDAYLKTKDLLISLVKANQDLRFVLLTSLRGHQVYFLADSESPESQLYTPPGQPYQSATEDYVSHMKAAAPFTFGPFQDRIGKWIVASVPAGLDSKQNPVNLELDIEARHWEERVMAARAPALFIGLLITLLLVTAFHAQERIRDQMAKLAISEQRNTVLVESSPNCVQMFDLEGRCLMINRAGKLAFGLTEEEVLGKPFVELWPAESKDVVAKAVETSIGGSPGRFDADYVRPDGRRVTFGAATNPVIDAAGVVQGFVCISADITIRKKAETALIAARNTAVAATQAKSEFLAVMSHEIRTPLGGIIGMLEAMKKLPQPAANRKYSETALDSAEQLLEVLDHILDASKLESGKMVLDPVPFHPVNEFTRAIEAQRTRAEAKGLILYSNFDRGVPSVLVGDSVRLRQVLANLLSNAIKFTSRGRVGVDIHGKPSSAGRFTLCITVSDTGIGIPEDTRRRLFRQFEQADVSTTRKFGGTGLGLSIIKSLVDLMDGEITLESHVGTGSTFSVSLDLSVGAEGTAVEKQDQQTSSNDSAVSSVVEVPAEPEGTPDRSTVARPAGISKSVIEKKVPTKAGALSILCAEDNATNRIIIQLILEQMGHGVAFAENGKEAVEALSQNDFDLVLMDNRMPVMDGFQATRLIRDPASKVLNHKVPVIALTANASKNYRDECIAAGMDDYLTKPVREPALKLAIEKAVYRRQQQTKKSNPAVVLPSPISSITVSEATSVGTPSPLSEEQLLAMLDEAEATPAPADAGSSLSPEALRKISQQYLHETPMLLNGMRVAWGARDAVSLGRAGHSLKSSSRYVKADRLSELGLKIEKLSDDRNFEAIAPLMTETDREFELVSERLQGEVSSS